MNWLIYLFCAFLICSVIATTYKKYYLEIFFLSFLIFITPAQIDISDTQYAPSLFTFFFNLLLEKDVSLRPLRPLVISIPLSLLVIFIFRFFKRKFF
tara:strand:+ start:1095 stop:1385 length:291 start_codon:yes stop_codon:yes gene_type:complete